MANKKQSIEAEARRAEVVKLHLRGHTQEQIATELGIDQGTVSRHIKRAREIWRENTIRDVQEAIDQELARTDQLAVAAWRAFDRSCEDEVQIEQDEVVSGDYVQPQGKRKTKRKGQAGGNEYLATVYKCIQKRCELLGLDAPKRQEITGKDGDAFFKLLNDDEKQRARADLIAFFNTETDN